MIKEIRRVYKREDVDSSIRDCILVYLLYASNCFSGVLTLGIAKEAMTENQENFMLAQILSSCFVYVIPIQCLLWFNILLKWTKADGLGCYLRYIMLTWARNAGAILHMLIALYSAIVIAQDEPLWAVTNILIVCV